MDFAHNAKQGIMPTIVHTSLASDHLHWFLVLFHIVVRINLCLTSRLGEQAEPSLSSIWSGLLVDKSWAKEVIGSLAHILVNWAWYDHAWLDQSYGGKKKQEEEEEKKSKEEEEEEK